MEWVSGNIYIRRNHATMLRLRINPMPLSHGEFQLGNLFIRDMGSIQQRHMAGDVVVEPHTHNFDHATFVIAGAYHFKLWRKAANLDGTPILKDDGTPVLVLVHDREARAPFFALVRAEELHSMVCTEDHSMAWCLYSHRDPQSKEVTQVPTGFLSAYR